MNPEKLCISCMMEIPEGASICPNCQFDPSGYYSGPHCLPPFTILKGRYLLGKVLGEGGFGITYIGYDLAGSRRVAIKELFIKGLLTRQRDSGDIYVDISHGNDTFYNECKDKFLQEAYILRKLEDKQGIVNIYDFFQEHRTAYIVMEYLDGVDLGTYLKERKRLTITEAFELLRPIMHSLISIHSVGIFHRDISPDNIRCLRDGSVKVMDLGSAKYNYSEGYSKIVLVKAGYAPPEQYTSGFKVGPWMDVYAIAATLYRCITGKKPKESIVRADDKDIIPPSRQGAVINRKQEAVLLKGLALHPEDRYQDMREFYHALKEALGLPVTKPKSPIPRNSPDPVVTVDDSYEKALQEMNADGDRTKQVRLIAAIAGSAGVLTVLLILNYAGVIPPGWIGCLPWM